MGRKRDVEKQNFKHKPASRASKRQQDPNSFKVKRINKNLKNQSNSNFCLTFLIYYFNFEMKI